MKVLSLHLYPIKGFAGISVTEAQTAAEGFVHDRRWMLVDKEGTFRSQRSHPMLALFQQSIGDQGLTIDYEGNQINIPFDLTDGNSLEVSVFDHKMLAKEVSPAISQWFSQQLNDSVRLVGHSQITQRVKQFPKDTGSTPVSFADGYPYLILGNESLAELNRRLATPLPMNRFRPNIVVDTSVAHEEDTWGKVTIGTQQFKVIKPCARCEVPTINQASAKRGKEPLKTLAKYRREGNKVLFGANAVSFGEGVVRVGDEMIFGI